MLFALAARDLASARIADLWAESARPDKEIEALELLRSSHPRLVGVNRRLAECYLHMDKPDLDVAIRRLKRRPVAMRLSARIVSSGCFCISAVEAQRRSGS